MDDSDVTAEFLLSFDGRINRAKYWHAFYIGIISCLARLVFLVFLVFALNVIFGTSVKSVHLDIYDIFNDPPSFPFRVSFGGSGLAWLVSLLFYAAAIPNFVFAIGSWRPPRSGGFTIATKAAGGSSRSSLLRFCLAKCGTGLAIPTRLTSSCSS